MKKLNRKGFTLVELLAVIVILAIVVGITLVTVLPTLKKSRQDAFEITAQTAADYLGKQYELYSIGEIDTINTNIKTSFDGLTFDATTGNSGYVSFTAPTIKAAGLKPENYISGRWYINKNTGRACVELTASTNTTATGRKNNLKGQAVAGEYYDVKITDTTNKTSVTKSDGC